MNPHLHVGTSGWSYPHWDKVFYQDVPQERRLSFYQEHFQTVEINTTFYHLPSGSAVKRWHDQVGDDFIFSVKASRYITHVKRLLSDKESLDLFYNSIRGLKKRCGPILFQLPPSFKRDETRLKAFIAELNKKKRYVFEFRHESWYTNTVFEILRKNKIALCISDLDGKPSPIEVTANFVYVRLHGPHRAYRGSYGKRRLLKWKKLILQWQTLGKEVFIYFDNDEKSYAVKDAKMLMEMIENG